MGRTKHLYSARLWLAALALVTGASFLPVPTAHANYPGMNGKIAFVRITGSDQQIVTAEADGTGITPITTTSGQYGAIDWAADGGKIAFDRTNESNMNEIWVMDPDGSDAHRVSPFGQARYSPSWSPDGRSIAYSDGSDVFRLDTVTGFEQKLTGDDEITGSCAGQDYTLPVYYSSPSWSPDNLRIAIIRSHELPPVEVMGTCDPNPNIQTDLAWITAQGSSAIPLTDDVTVDTLPDWSPDSTTIVWQRGNSAIGVARRAWISGPITQLTTFGGRPRYSPDGTKILFTRDANADNKNDIWVMDALDGGNKTAVVQDSSYNWQQDWQPIPDNGLVVTLRAFSPAGEEITGSVTAAQTVNVELTIRNETPDTLDNFVFADNVPLKIDDRSTGDADIISGPTPTVDANLSLDPDEEVSYAYAVQMNVNGKVAATTRVTADRESGGTIDGQRSLLFQITDGEELTNELVNYVTMMALDDMLQGHYGQWVQAFAARGLDFRDRLSTLLSPANKQKWGFVGNELPLSPLDFALSSLHQNAPEMIAALFPKEPVGDYSAEQLDDIYSAAFKKEVGKGASKYVKGWSDLAGKVKKAAMDSYSSAVIASFVMFGQATPEERMQFEANLINVADGFDYAREGFVKHVKRTNQEMADAGGNPVWYALKKSMEVELEVSLAVQGFFAEDERARHRAALAADTDPKKYMQMMAALDGKIFNKGAAAIADILIPSGVIRGAGVLKKVVFRGAGAAVERMGQAAGVVDTRARVIAEPTAVTLADSGTPAGLSGSEMAQLERNEPLLGIDDAKVIQSTDAGHVWEAPNVGGVPEAVIDAKAKILGKLEARWNSLPGKQPIKLAEVMKTGKPYLKENMVAKTEMTAQKTGEPAMLHAGAPAEVVGEANIWRSNVAPHDRPGWADLSAQQRQKAVLEFEKANERWAEFENPAADSKTARLKQCIGQRGTVPLDVDASGNPVSLNGNIQRWVEAEYETVDVSNATSEAKLFRVKYYRTFVKDANTGQILNSKVVVDSPTALVQGPDADALALAKVIGEDAQGNPILGPLEGDEQRLVQWNIDENIKARKLDPSHPDYMPGATQLPEHGPTWHFIDGTSKAAGYLVPTYGATFMPEVVGTNLLSRMADSLAGPNASFDKVFKMYKKMIDLVHANGGFGQHAVIVTTDKRWLGAVPVQEW